MTKTDHRLYLKHFLAAEAVLKGYLLAATGDMHAADNVAGYFLLTLQVLLGYILLGALVTRFAVLFQAEGPAGKFTKEKRKKRNGRDGEGRKEEEI